MPPLSPQSTTPIAAPTTRLAPSPTGALHLGNARTFLINWALARTRGWRILLRVEDLDGPRIKPDSLDDILRTLEWLGIDWDEGPIIQSNEPGPHVEAMRALVARGLAYPCELTRAEIEAAASAPHDAPAAPRADPAPGEPPVRTSAESRFPPGLRPPGFDAPHPFDDAGTNWRFITRPRAEGGSVAFTDEFAGPQDPCPHDTIGDFVVWTKRAQPAYQLAVVVDDHRQGVTHIVRGNDLLDSAARQRLLYRALGFAPEPRYCHLPLVVGEDGRRLAKRHGDTRVSRYREGGVPAERIIALLARWSGIAPRTGDAPAPGAMSAREFAARFALDTLPARPAVFTPADDAWLLDR